MLDSLFEAAFGVLYPMTIVLIAGAAEVEAWVGRRARSPGHRVIWLASPRLPSTVASARASLRATAGAGRGR
jgi:hypothetical protein